MEQKRSHEALVPYRGQPGAGRGWRQGVVDDAIHLPKDPIDFVAMIGLTRL
jgi:hypothetical protein